jgi:hypothetical protein
VVEVFVQFPARGRLRWSRQGPEVGRATGKRQSEQLLVEALPEGSACGVDDDGLHDARHMAELIGLPDGAASVTAGLMILTEID